jgi:YidC/Oxa1 family membrane protein insertase
MDKRSILGLLIIGAILLIFSIFNGNQQAEKTPGEQNESTAQTQHTKTDKPVTNGNLVPKRDSLGNQIIDSLDRWVYVDTLTNRDTFIVLTESTTTIGTDSTKKQVAPVYIPEKTVRLENDLLILDVTNKGGHIKNVFLKKFKTYDAFIGNKTEPLQLIDSASTFYVEFFEGAIKRHSKDYTFRFVENTATSATVEMLNATGKKVQYRYSLTEGKYDVGFQVSFKGFAEADAPNISFRSNFKLRSTEKYLPNEKQVAALFFKYNEESYDYLQGHTWMPLEQTTQWVAFKQSYFSAILMSNTGFPRTDKSKISIKDLPETDSTYVKQLK